jgi:hypothetical protein
LHKEPYDGILELYYSNDFLNILSDIIGKPVQRISLSDPNACSLLTYTNKGDHINWHLDYSNYYGDRFVVLLTIVNENKEGDDLSANVFKYTHNVVSTEFSPILNMGNIPDLAYNKTPTEFCPSCFRGLTRGHNLDFIYTNVCKEFCPFPKWANSWF